MIIHVTSEQQFDDLIKGSVLIDFYADWCGPCRLLKEVLEEIDSDGSLGFDIAKVNIDDLPNIARRYSVMSIPTLLVYKDGKLVKNLLGYLPKKELLSTIKK